MYKYTFLVVLMSSFGFVCDTDRVNPDDELLITNLSSSNVYIFTDAYHSSVDTISCGLFNSFLAIDEFFLAPGDEFLFVDEFANSLREDADLEFRVYAYKVNTIDDVPLCPLPIESLADTVIFRTVDDLDGDILTPVVIE